MVRIVQNTFEKNSTIKENRLSAYSILSWQPLLRPPLPNQEPPAVPRIPIKALSCRNAITSFAVLVTAEKPVESARLVFSDLVCGDSVLSSDTITARLVGTVPTAEWGLVCDPLFEVAEFPIDKNATVYASVKVPKGITAGKYTGKVTLIVEDNEVASNDVEVDVANVDLPDVQDWSFYLSVWMNAGAIARNAGVEIWSDEHFEALRPYVKDLAGHGQKSVFLPICDKFLEDATRDPHPSLVKWMKRGGDYEFDFTMFDRYVDLYAEYGVDESIHCYGILSAKGYTGESTIEYLDMDSGERHVIVMHIDDEEYIQAWGAFFKEFQRHLTKRGWMYKTHIGAFNLGPAMAQKAMAFLSSYAPDFRISQGSTPGHDSIDTAEDLSLRIDCDNRGVTEIAQVERSSKGLMEYLTQNDTCEAIQEYSEKTQTTFYVCAVPSHPNTFVVSPLVESRMLPFLALQGGVDGFVRWSYCDWSDDPFNSPGWGEWPTGDTFLVYPGESGPVSSLRWEQLREGIQDFELAMIASLNVETPDDMVDYEQAITLACRDADGRIKSTGDIEIARRLLIPIAERGDRL